MVKLLKKRRPALAVQPSQSGPQGTDIGRRQTDAILRPAARLNSVGSSTSTTGASTPLWYGGATRRGTAPTFPTIDPQTGERLYHFDSETSTLVGDRAPTYDVGELMHALTRDISVEDLNEIYAQREQHRPPGEDSVASLPEDLWQLIGTYMSLADQAALSFATKTLMIRINWEPIWKNLGRPENKVHKLDFLYRLDKTLPLHLLCSQCAIYHPRIKIGQETYKPDFVNNPLFNCPNVRNSWLPRIKIAYRREMPFAFVQLATRERKYGALYGISASSLDRRWRCSESDWSHASRFVVVKGRLLMRVVSQCIAEPGMVDTERRLLLLDRTDYNPYFSHCAHWRVGDLMKVCKCTLSHIPQAPERIRDQLKDGRAPSLAARNRNFAVSQCEDCRDIRRCPSCPTEYLIQIKMVEAKNDITGRPTFKHAIQVTRWSDLGVGSSPFLSREWAACCAFNEQVEGMSQYESFKEVGKRTLNGIFEAETNNHLFLRRVVSLDPRKGNLRHRVSEEWEERRL